MDHGSQISDARTERGIKLFMIVTALVGLGMGLSDFVLANYFNEAYQITPLQRGYIEFPRELPGVIAIFAIGGLAFLGNVRSGIIAQVLALAGILVLALIRPDFYIMLIFLFIHSLGTHMYLPIADSIGLSLTKPGSVGRVMGRINSAKMASFMVAGLITFLGFRFGAFSFDTPIGIFLFAVIFFALAAVFLVFLYRVIKEQERAAPKRGLNIVIRKKYLRYYAICALFGGRKQIMLVYSPWVLIYMLGFRADTMAVLGMIGAGIGIFFLPVIGRCIDRFGIRRVMVMEALAFMGVYLAYGFLSGWINSQQTVVLTGVMMILVYILNIVDRMSAQFGIVRSIFLKSIAVSPDDVTPSIALGMSIDHIFAISGALICGIIWHNFGPQYVFAIAGLMSFGNMLIARGIKPPAETVES